MKSSLTAKHIRVCTLISLESVISLTCGMPSAILGECSFYSPEFYGIHIYKR